MKYTKTYIDDIKSVLNSGLPLYKIYGKKLLVTGASGLICSAVIDIIIYANENMNADIQLYLAGRNFDSLRKRFGRYSEATYFHFIKYDATKPITFDIEVDYIIHGASNAQPSAYVSEPIETMRANFVGLDSLLSYAQERKCERTLYISSSEVYGHKEGNYPYLEHDYGYIDILSSRSCYPISKRAGETLCVCYQQQHGLDVTIVRPGHIYGPTATSKDGRATVQFANNVLTGNNIVMKTPGTQLRSYCYVLDCASAILTVLLNGKSGEAYNISNKNSIVTIRQIAEEFAKNAGCDVVFSEADEVEKRGYNQMENSSLDSTKLESLGWKAIFDLELGVKRTLLCLKDE